MNQNPTKAWVCPICGYVHYGSEPPDECPICGAGGGAFTPEAVEETPAVEPVVEQSASRIVIAGAGVAGVSAAEAARRAAPAADIWLLSNETDLPYYRLNLTRYLMGDIGADQLDLHPENWYASSRIRLLRGVELTGIDLDGKNVSLNDGSRISFDRLVLTTGARPFVPPIPGAGLPGVWTLRTRRDAESILAAVRGEYLGKPVVCIGGGLLGLETAGALARQGVNVTVLENQAWLMPRQLNQKAARVFQAYVEKLGIHIRNNAKVRALLGVDALESVALEDGTSLPAGMVIFSAGVRANTTLAAQAGLAVQQGIVVDDALRTSHPDVFAAGDAAEHTGTLYGTWAPALAQGAVAGASAAGQPAVFQALPRAHTLKVLGIDLFSTGKVAPAAEDVLIEAAGEDGYTGFLFQGSILVGAILLGDASASGVVKKAVESRQDCVALLAKQPAARDIPGLL
jgi:nitrite reductase (NADH) large subunit